MTSPAPLDPQLQSADDPHAKLNGHAPSVDEEENAADSKPVRIIIADDHAVVRIGVRNLLTSHGRFSVVGESETIKDTVQQAIALLPDVLLMDYYMPDGSGAEALETLRENAPSVRIVLLTGELTPALAVEAFLAGVRGLVLKSAVSESISVALLAVFEGSYWADGQRIKDREEMVRRFTRPTAAENARAHKLTKRELDVTALIVKGHTNREIAQELSLSEETVKRHLSNVFDKLGISTRLELAILAIERNFASRT